MHDRYRYVGIITLQVSLTKKRTSESILIHNQLVGEIGFCSPIPGQFPPQEFWYKPATNLPRQKQNQKPPHTTPCSFVFIYTTEAEACVQQYYWRVLGHQITILAGTGTYTLRTGPVPAKLKNKTENHHKKHNDHDELPYYLHRCGSISQPIHPRRQRLMAWRTALTSSVDIVSVAWLDVPSKLGSYAIYFMVHVMCSSTSHAP